MLATNANVELDLYKISVPLKDKEIENLKRDLSRVKQQKEEFEAANHRQRARIISVQSEVDQIRNERDSIQNQCKSLQTEIASLKVKYIKKIHNIMRCILHITYYLYSNKSSI